MSLDTLKLSVYPVYKERDNRVFTGTIFLLTQNWGSESAISRTMFLLSLCSRGHYSNRLHLAFDSFDSLLASDMGPRWTKVSSNVSIFVEL